MSKKIRTNTSVGIMVDLDAILDTRKGTITKLYPELIEEIQHSPKYHLRKSDDWEMVDPRLDTARLTLNYQGRNLETIKHSKLTMVSRMIVELVNKLLLEVGGNNPEISRFFFVVNLHPYNLPADIKAEICKLLGHQLGILEVPIGFVELPWSGLNISFLKDNNIRYWYCYHYEEWLKHNFEPTGKEEIDKNNIPSFPECRIFAPTVSQNQKELDKFLETMIDCPVIDQFELTKSIFSSIITFDFAPVASFCEIDPEKFKRLELENELERSEVLSTPEMVVNALMKRIGDKPQVSKLHAAKYLEQIEQLVYELQLHNNQETFTLFKTRLAELNLTVAKLYNSVPFNSGEDLEQLLDGLSLSVDTTIEEYLATEEHWNKLGVATIKVEEDIGTGEIVYRCFAAEDHEQIKTGDLLSPPRTFKNHVKPADAINFLGYFGAE